MTPDCDAKTVIKEIEAAGLRATIEKTGGGHLKITWAAPGKPARTYFAASTPSDWRGRLNARAEVRRYLRADNVTLDREERKTVKPKTDLERALAVPTHHETLVDSVAALRAEVADLTEVCLSLASSIQDLMVRGTSAAVPQIVRDVAEAQAGGIDASVLLADTAVPLAINGADGLEPGAQPATNGHAIVAIEAKHRKPHGKQDMTQIADYLSAHAWTHIDTLIERSGIKHTVAWNKLYYLHKKGSVERSGDKYRLARGPTTMVRERKPDEARKGAARTRSR